MHRVVGPDRQFAAVSCDVDLVGGEWDVVISRLGGQCVANVSVALVAVRVDQSFALARIFKAIVAEVGRQNFPAQICNGYKKTKSEERLEPVHSSPSPADGD